MDLAPGGFSQDFFNGLGSIQDPGGLFPQNFPFSSRCSPIDLYSNLGSFCLCASVAKGHCNKGYAGEHCGIAVIAKRGSFIPPFSFIAELNLLLRIKVFLSHIVVVCYTVGLALRPE